MATWKAPAEWGGRQTYVEYEFYSTTKPSDGKFRKKILELKCVMRDWAEIYSITCLGNGLQYVGKAFLVTGKEGCVKKYRWWGTFRRFDQHLSDAKKKGGGNCTDLNAAIREFGADEFNVTPLLTCRVEDVPKYEKFFMDEYGTLEGGMNIRDPEESVRLPAVTCERMSDRRKGEKHWNHGKMTPVTTKKKISQTNLEMAWASRRDFDGVTLMPKGMAKIDWEGMKGYHVVSHPTLRDKKSVTTTAWNETKRLKCYNKCLAYLKTAA